MFREKEPAASLLIELTRRWGGAHRLRRVLSNLHHSSTHPDLTLYVRIYASISAAHERFPSDHRQMSTNYRTFIIYFSDVMLRLVRAWDFQLTAVGLHFIMMTMYKKASRLCATVCFVSLSSQVPFLPFPLLLFSTSIPLSHIGSLPLPELPTGLSQRCSSCSSPSGSSFHSCLPLQLSTLLDVLLILDTPCLSATDRYMANDSSITPP